MTNNDLLRLVSRYGAALSQCNADKAVIQTLVVVPPQEGLESVHVAD